MRRGMERKVKRGVMEQDRERERDREEWRGDGWVRSRERWKDKRGRVKTCGGEV